MAEVLEVVLTALFAFHVADYALGRALVNDPLRAVVAAVFSVLLVVVAGVLSLADVIS